MRQQQQPTMSSHWMVKVVCWALLMLALSGLAEAHFCQVSVAKLVCRWH